MMLCLTRAAFVVVTAASVGIVTIEFLKAAVH